MGLFAFPNLSSERARLLVRIGQLGFCLAADGVEEQRSAALMEVPASGSPSPPPVVTTRPAWLLEASHDTGLTGLRCALIGAPPAWLGSAGWGPYPAGGLGLVLVIVLVLVLLGRI